MFSLACFGHLNGLIVKYRDFLDKYIKKKLDGVGPVDNRPSTDKLDHFVRKKIK